MSGKSKSQGFSTVGGLVYSTEAGRLCPGCEQPIGDCSCSDADLILGSGRVTIGHETKGRKGKGVTLIKELAMTGVALNRCAQELKKHCGTGGSVKGNVIEIQGDQRLKIQTLLAAKGISAKLTGGKL